MSRVGTIHQSLPVWIADAKTLTKRNTSVVVMIRGSGLLGQRVTWRGERKDAEQMSAMPTFVCMDGCGALPNSPAAGLIHWSRRHLGVARGRSAIWRRHLLLHLDLVIALDRLPMAVHAERR